MPGQKFTGPRPGSEHTGQIRLRQTVLLRVDAHHFGKWCHLDGMMPGLVSLNEGREVPRALSNAQRQVPFATMVAVNDLLTRVTAFLEA